MTNITNLNVGKYVLYVRALIVLTNSGLSTIHALDVLCTSFISLLCNFGLLLCKNRVKPTEFQYA